jgi:hypothetical protein
MGKALGAIEVRHIEVAASHVQPFAGNRTQFVGGVAQAPLPTDSEQPSNPVAPAFEMRPKKAFEAPKLVCAAPLRVEE